MLTATNPSVLRCNDARLIDLTGSFKKNPASRVDPSGKRHEHTQDLRPTAPVKSDVDNKQVDVLDAMLPSSYTEITHETLFPVSLLKQQLLSSCHQLGPQALGHRTRSPQLSHPIAPSPLSDACGHLFYSHFLEHLLESAQGWMVCNPPPFFF